MKLARWFDQGIQEGLVLEREDGLVVAPFPESHSTQGLIDAGLKLALEELNQLDLRAQDGKPLSEVKLLTPYEPASVRDGVAFEEHVEGVVKSVDNSSGVTPEWYDFPTFYFTNPHALIATGELLTPPPSQRLDFELEVGIVVGALAGQTRLSNLTPEDAKQSIFGLLVFNDWSARDIQAREMKVRLGPAKGKDFGTTIGPWIVTADEFESHYLDGFIDLQMRVWVNDELIGQDSLANIGWPLPELVAYASRNSVVRAGDLIGTGTCGSGCLAELWGRAGELTPRPLLPGDIVKMWVEGIGEIQNEVGKPVLGPTIPPARPGRRVKIER
jgi:2-keto-4-pentenoate hydratase/2-oxohepta-3-ene-1,7-dioic acid hydratase in catechol pathway